MFGDGISNKVAMSIAEIEGALGLSSVSLAELVAEAHLQTSSIK